MEVDAVGCAKVVLEMQGRGRVVEGLYGIRVGG